MHQTVSQNLLTKTISNEIIYSIKTEIERLFKD